MKPEEISTPETPLTQDFCQKNLRLYEACFKTSPVQLDCVAEFAKRFTKHAQSLERRAAIAESAQKELHYELRAWVLEAQEGRIPTQENIDEALTILARTKPTHQPE